MVKDLPATQETWVQSLGREDSWRRKWLLTPVFLPGEFRGQRSLVSYSWWGQRESDMTELVTLSPYLVLYHLLVKIFTFLSFSSHWNINSQWQRYGSALFIALFKYLDQHQERSRCSAKSGECLLFMPLLITLLSVYPNSSHRSRLAETVSSMESSLISSLPLNSKSLHSVLFYSLNSSGGNVVWAQTATR